MRPLLTALTALMLFATPVVAGDWEDGVDAVKAGDYQKAFRLFKPLAEQGNLLAQTALGFMYRGGQGVPKDSATVAQWFRAAAEQGSMIAQASLDLLYGLGEGVPQNNLQAYAWVSSAAAQGNEDAKNDIGIIREQMTIAQIAEAQKLSSELWEKYVVPFQKD